MRRDVLSLIGARQQQLSRDPQLLNNSFKMPTRLTIPPSSLLTDEILSWRAARRHRMAVGLPSQLLLFRANVCTHCCKLAVECAYDIIALRLRPLPAWSGCVLSVRIRCHTAVQMTLLCQSSWQICCSMLLSYVRCGRWLPEPLRRRRGVGSAHIYS